MGGVDTALPGMAYKGLATVRFGPTSRADRLGVCVVAEQIRHNRRVRCGRIGSCGTSDRDAGQEPRRAANRWQNLPVVEPGRSAVAGGNARSEDIVDEARVAHALHGALERGEICAWFQPQVDLQTDRIVAAEALCRWQHPEWGMIGPNEFIPIAEENGLIGEIGRFMTAEALDLVATTGLDVSVNVSPVQLENSRFLAWLERLLRYTRRSVAERLTLEVTEGRRLVDAPAMIARLNRIRRLGAGVAIDDFGSGQASLTQLKRLHATELKIDRSLLVDPTVTAERILTAAIDVARRARIRVVAEGIETREQLERVTRLGCDRGQGFLLGHPMPRLQLERLLK